MPVTPATAAVMAMTVFMWFSGSGAGPASWGMWARGRRLVGLLGSGAAQLGFFQVSAPVVSSGMA